MPLTPTTPKSLSEALEKYWGYDSFLPLQEEAMRNAIEGRDSVVVLPTGGGKSLCYQAPAVCLEGLTLVISPLISLMKDQVDSLRDCGIAAASVHSMSPPEEKRQIATDVREGKLKLLYCAPERIVQPRTLAFLQSVQVAQVAIDEAHCISQWGHDFRRDYRQLRMLKKALPGVAVHAYTATATEQVREDVAQQLGLVDPDMLVGSFDRPNLVYRVRRRERILDQIRSVIDRHKSESGIVYCISRKEVEKTAALLTDAGYRARPYHAGMEARDRLRHQEEFASESIDTIVATVAFGMGIDKSNVRYVIHAGMPKSLEQYQQESGRAGRDGLEAECWLFYSGGDYGLWRRMIENPMNEDHEPTPEELAAQRAAIGSLQDMSSFCQGAECRHRAIVRHFGQDLTGEQCGGCDFCLEELDLVEDSLTIGQKILSCVLRLEQGFGADYTTKVLVGSREERIRERNHDQLSTWGILSEHATRSVRDWIEQLVGQGFLDKAGEYNVLELTEAGADILRGRKSPRLLKPAPEEKGWKKQSGSSNRSRAGSSGSEEESWQGVDRALFEHLRNLRRELATERSVPAYIVFGDRSLRDMARRQPQTLEEFSQVTGVGARKQEEYGEVFVESIREFTSSAS